MDNKIVKTGVIATFAFALYAVLDAFFGGIFMMLFWGSEIYGVLSYMLVLALAAGATFAAIFICSTFVDKKELNPIMALVAAGAAGVATLVLSFIFSKLQMQIGSMFMSFIYSFFSTVLFLGVYFAAGFLYATKAD